MKMKKTKSIFDGADVPSANYHLVDSTNLIPFPPGTITISQPNYVGYYKIGGDHGLHFCFTTKPKWFHRKMMKLCLGWEWVDKKL